MTIDQLPDPLVSDDAPAEEPGPAPRTKVLAAQPRLPSSPTPSQSRPRPEQVSPGQPEASTPVSTDLPVSPAPPTASAPASDLVPPEDLRKAISQAAEVTLVIFGQGAAIVHRRVAPDKAGDPKRWVPTRDERRRIAAPVGRIAKRHVASSAEAADMIDGALITAGLGSFVLRAAFDVEEAEGGS